MFKEEREESQFAWSMLMISPPKTGPYDKVEKWKVGGRRMGRKCYLPKGEAHLEDSVYLLDIRNSAKIRSS